MSRSRRVAVVTGITGQDGAYLAEFLLEKGYVVYGTYRRAASKNFWRIKELGIHKNDNLHLIEYELTDACSAITLLEKTQPDEVYNLAAQSFVGISFDQPHATTQITGVGPLNLLEAIRRVNRTIRFYQASSSEMFGKVQVVPQTEGTPFYPRSPYGIAKLYAHWMTINYRESYNIFGVSGILFNHESPLRGEEFVTRKITKGIAKILAGELDHISLGNLGAKRDWGFAKDYVEGMYLMLQAESPDTFVLATGRTQTVREFVEMSFDVADVKLAWEGSGLEEVGINTATGDNVVKINPNYYRPCEVDLLIGDATKAKDVLGWTAKTPLEKLCQMMVESDMRRIKQKKSILVEG